MNNLSSSDSAPLSTPAPRSAPPPLPLDPWKYPTTDTGNAERLIARHGKNLRYCPAKQAWFFWNKRRWSEDTLCRFKALTKDTVRAICREVAAVRPQKANAEGQALAEARRTALAAWARRSESKERRDAIAPLAQGEPDVVIGPEAFDADPWLLNVANGTIDLRTGELGPHERSHLLTKLARVAFDPEATCPAFDAFLSDVFLGDAELIAFVWRAIGYSLTGETREQCFFLCYGTGENGKSTLFEVLRELLGTYSLNADFSTFASHDKPNAGQARPDLVRLRGARFVSAAEPDQQVRLSESVIKIVTGEDPITARGLYEAEQIFHPVMKLWLMANHRPVVQESNHGFWRRVRLVPFAWQVPPDKKDNQLKKKLLAELPGIAARAVRACLLWQREGLGLPRAVAQATADYRGEMDRVGSFLVARCVVDKSTATTVRAKELYEAYTQWCEANGEQALTQTTFGKRLTERGLRKGTSGGRTLYRGLRLFTPEETTALEAEARTLPVDTQDTGDRAAPGRPGGGTPDDAGTPDDGGDGGEGGEGYDMESAWDEDQAEQPDATPSTVTTLTLTPSKAPVPPPGKLPRSGSSLPPGFGRMRISRDAP